MGKPVKFLLRCCHLDYWGLAVVISMVRIGFSQDTLTLTRAIRLGERHNYDLMKVEVERSLDSPSKRVAWGRFLPLITLQYSAETSHYFSQTYINPDGTVSSYPRVDTLFIPRPDSTGYLRYPDQPTIRVTEAPRGSRKTSSWGVRVEQVLFDGGRNIIGLKQSALESQRRHWLSQLTRGEIRRAVVEAYCNAFTAQQRLKVAEQNVQRRSLLLEVAKARFEAGSVTRRDVLQAEVELGRARNDSLNAVLTFHQALSRLNLTLGLPHSTQMNLAPLPSLRAYRWSTEDLIRIAEQTQPEIKILLMEKESALNDIRTARGEYLPTLSLTLTHSRSEQAGSKQGWRFDPRNRFTTLGLSSNLMVFDRFTRSLKVQEGRVRMREKEIEEIKRWESIKNEIALTAKQLEAIHRQIEVAQQNAVWATETLNFEEERYRLGATTIIEVMAAQSSFVQAQMELNNLIADYHITLARLESLVGKPLREEEDG